MAEQVFSLNELDIVGYADVLNEHFVPQLVPPIFRAQNDPDLIIMPPFQIEGDRVEGAEAGDQGDFERAVARGQVTCLDVAISARPDHKLWIDEAFVPHYEPAIEVTETLRGLAQEKARQALRAVTLGRLEEAARLAQTAISADDTCLNAILAKALICHLERDQTGVEILSEIAAAIVPGVDLQAWVELYSDLAWVNRVVSPRYDPYGELPLSNPISYKEIAQALISSYRPLREVRLDPSSESWLFAI